MNSRIKLMMLCSTLSVLASCTGGSGGASGNNNSVTPKPAPAPVEEVSNSVQISSTAKMPTTSSSGQSFRAVIYNDTNEAIKFDSASALTHTYQYTKDISGTKTSLYNLSACTGSSLAPKQSCVAIITPQGTDGGFALQAKFRGSESGKVYNAIQVFHYGEVAANNGFMVDTSTITQARKTSHFYDVAIPFVLDKDYADVTVSSDVATAKEPSIVCDSKNKGGSCTAFLTYKGGSYTSKVTLSGMEKSVQQTKVKSQFSNQATTLSTANTATLQVNVTSNNVANLITNGSNAIAKLGELRKISFYNNGLAPANITSITATPNLAITTGGCVGVIADGSQCEIDVMNNSESNTIGQITITSNLGALTFNIFQTSNSKIPAFTISANGNWLYTVLSQPQDVVFNVKNISTSNTKLNNFAFTALPSGFSYVTNGGTNPCDTSGKSTKLGQNESCTLTVRYSPSIAITPNNLTIAGSASYLESNGATRTIANKVAVSYSAIASVAHLTFSPATLDLGSIRADGAASIESTITITNDGDTDATGFSFDSSTFAANNLTFTNLNCSATLAKSLSCNVKVKFGPLVVDKTISAVSIISQSTRICRN